MTPHPQSEAGPALLPCPFCPNGGKPEYSEYDGRSIVQCQVCEIGIADTNAVARWNRRAPLEGPTGLPPEFHRDGDLLYTLMDAGFHRGQPIVKNRVSLSFSFDKSVSEDEREAVIESVRCRSLPPAEGVSEKVRGALEAYLAAGHKEARRAASVLAKEALRLLPEDKRGGEL